MHSAGENSRSSTWLVQGEAPKDSVLMERREAAQGHNWMPKWLAQDESPEDSVLMERWEAEQGHNWMSTGWWILLIPLGFWVWLQLVALVLKFLSWIFGV